MFVSEPQRASSTDASGYNGTYGTSDTFDLDNLTADSLTTNNDFNATTGIFTAPLIWSLLNLYQL